MTQNKKPGISNFHISVVKACLDAGLTVCYIDKDAIRRGEVRRLDNSYSRLGVANGALSGYGGPHMNVLILVNEDEFEPTMVKEFKNIPGYVDGIYPNYIYLNIY